MRASLGTLNEMHVEKRVTRMDWQTFDIVLPFVLHAIRDRRCSLLYDVVVYLFVPRWQTYFFLLRTCDVIIYLPKSSYANNKIALFY
jgi:hypothetical protein